MNIETYLTGLFPKSLKLRKILRDFYKNKANKEDVDRVFLDETNKLIELQKNNSLSYIYDGMLKWLDLLRPFTKYDGIEEGPLIRWFETNFFYRQPIINGKISLLKPVLKDYFEIDLIKKEKLLSFSIIDPLTFVYLSVNNYYKENSELLYDFIDALSKDINFLKEENLTFSLINIISPYLTFSLINKEYIYFLNYFIKKLRNIYPNSKISLNLYFIKNYQNLELLNESNVDILTFDMCYGDREKIVEKIKDLNFDLGLGLIDSNISLIEDPEYLKKEILRINGIVKKDKIYLTTSSDLDRLPYELACEKVNVIGKLLKII